jgi:hypothetical protein
VLEALASAVVAGLALAGLTAVASLATSGLRLARDTTIALALAAERLEALRVGPRANGDDSRTGPDGTVFARSWRSAGGRGTPARLSVHVAWVAGPRGRRTLDLATEVPP